MVDQPTVGQRFADIVTSTVGSWKFIICQTIILGTWIVLNSTGLGWDPFPFILCNLALSFQAAYTAPFILMSQGRQAAIDRATLEADLDANVEELTRLDRIEIHLQEHLEQQMKAMTEKLTEVIRTLHEDAATARRRGG